MSKKQVRKCDRCGHEEVHDTEIWRKIEKVAIHGSGCGGRFPEPVASIGRRK